MKRLLTWITGVAYTILGCTSTGRIFKEIEVLDWYFIVVLLLCSLSLTFIGIRTINKAIQ